MMLDEALESPIISQSLTLFRLVTPLETNPLNNDIFNKHSDF